MRRPHHPDDNVDFQRTPLPDMRPSPLLSPYLLVAAPDEEADVMNLLGSGLATATISWADGRWSLSSRALTICAEHSVVHAPLDRCVAAVALSPDAGELLRELMRQRPVDDFPPLMLLGPAGSTTKDEAMQTIIRRLVLLLHESACGASQLHRQLSLMRNEHARLQRTLESWEGWMASQPPSAQLCFAYPTTSRSIKLFAANGPLRQPLPVPTTGLARIALFVAGSVSTATTLTCELYCEESDEVLATWAARPAQASSSKLILALPRAVSGPDRSATLVLSVPSSNASVDLIVGPAHPTGGALLPTGTFDSPLALSLWTAVPGAPLHISTNDTLPIECTVPKHGQAGARTNSSFIVHLDPARLADAIPLCPSGVSIAHVEFKPEGAALQVHPVPDAITIARVHEACPPDATALTAKIALSHEQSPDVEFCCVVSELMLDHAHAEEMLGSAAETDGPQWIRLARVHSPSLVRIPLSPSSWHRHLYLATRTPAGESSAYAWAQFSDLRFESRIWDVDPQ